jgi:hypothetical protein
MAPAELCIRENNMNIKLEQKDGIDAVVYSDGPPGWWRPASPDEVALWNRIQELEKALREAMEWNWLDEDSPPPQEVVDQCNSALMGT